MAKYVGVCVYRRSYLLWSPVILIVVFPDKGLWRTNEPKAKHLERFGEEAVILITITKN